jgi:hypothetical protein
MEFTTPQPYSAASSKRDLDQDGPLFFSSLAHGEVPAVPPHTVEHPEALAIIILLPNN